MSDGDCLLVIDLQPDFMAGGKLAVAGGNEIEQPILDLMSKFPTVVATQDWHPAGHVSFASSHHDRKPFKTIKLHGHAQTLWPDHCVQTSHGASLPQRLVARADIIVRKGAKPDVDSYSAFNENYGPGGFRCSTGLLPMLLARYVRRIFICGLARDYCVLWSAQDCGMVVPTFVLWNLTRAVNPADDEQTELAFRKAGVTVEQS